METNFYGVIQTTPTLLPLIRKSSNPGVIVNVSSTLASSTRQAHPDSRSSLNIVAYTTSKTAMNSYSISLAHELKAEGIKVVAVCPGYTSTKLNHHAPNARPPKEGAESLVPWVLLDKDGPTSKFFDRAGNELPW